mmetsp:Transcript_28519/g.42692  ORF Transcript_28519/g.42692 Transcript_28519/m.42692 type:complete len:80 (-) Transcript_28519:102-341(-)
MPHLVRFFALYYFLIFDLHFTIGVLELFGNQLQGSMPPSVCQRRDINNGMLDKLTADCDLDDIPFVNCSVPDCCTDCPF